MYLGQCIVDSPMRLLPQLFILENNSPFNCMIKCLDAVYPGDYASTGAPESQYKGYTIAGVQNNKQCFYGNGHILPDFFTNASQCNEICPGDKRFKCGGFYKMNIYKTGLPSYVEP